MTEATLPSPSTVTVPRDAVYVYLTEGRAEFRRPDHRPPSRLGVLNLAAVVWAAPDGTPHGVALYGHALAPETIAKALAWGAANPRPYLSPLPMLPWQERAFQELAALDLATVLHGTVGAGVAHITVAAAARRALDAGVETVHVVCPAPVRSFIGDLFADAFSGATGAPQVRFSRNTDEDIADLAASAQVVLIADPYPTTRVAARAAALKQAHQRGAVVYASQWTEGVDVKVVPGLGNPMPPRNPLAGAPRR